jgi:mRNA interferase MazF
MNLVKRFLEWIQLKEKLHESNAKPPLFAEREVWWASLGENIGKEINGKSELFTRPVLVLKKLSSETFMAIPTTSQERKGTWYVLVSYGGYQVSVILSQARIMDARRLSTRLGRLDERDFKRVKEGFKQLYLK